MAVPSNGKKELTLDLGQSKNIYVHRISNQNIAIRQKTVRRTTCRKPDMRYQVKDDGTYDGQLTDDKIKKMNRNRKTTAERHNLHRALLLISMWNHTLFLHEFLGLIGVRRVDADDDVRYVYKPSQQREMVLDMFIFMMKVQYGVDVDNYIEDVVANATFIFPLEPRVRKWRANQIFGIETVKDDSVVRYRYKNLLGDDMAIYIPPRNVCGVFWSTGLDEAGRALPYFQTGELQEEDLRREVKTMFPSELPATRTVQNVSDEEEEEEEDD
jgi:hypothetical protein